MSVAFDRLVEACAACLCWAEWPNLDDRTDDPWFHWQTVSPHARARYMRDARRIASLMRTDEEYALVPVKATDRIRGAGLSAGRGIRTQIGAAHVFEEMLKAARVEMQWRSGDTEDESVEVAEE